MTHLRTLTGVLLIALASCVACGYHTAGHNVALPQDVKSIAIPSFKNETLSYRIEHSVSHRE
jgi:hypothetical protein